MTPLSTLYRTFRLSAFFLCFALPVLAFADSGRESTEAIRALGEKVKAYTLPNGLRVTMYRRGVAPVFAGVVGVRVGGTDERMGETGISHMFEHMAFKGTSQIGTKDFIKEKPLLEEQEKIIVEARGREFNDVETKRLAEIRDALENLWDSEAYSRVMGRRGASGLNATTDQELTKYFVNLPRSAFEFWCWIESERLSRPVFRHFYQERDVVLEERRMRNENEPSGRMYDLLLSTAFHVHPYKNPVIGYEADIRGLTASMLDRFHKQYYVPGNMTVSVVGDVNPESDIEIIKKYFGRMPARPMPDHSVPAEPAQDQPREGSVTMQASPQLYIAYKKPSYPDPKDPPISLLQEVLAGGPVSPLYRELVNKRQVALRVDVEEAPGSAYPNLFLFSIIPRAPHTNADVVAAFKKVIEQFKSTGPTVDDMEVAKRSIAVQYLGELRSNLAMARNLASATLIYNDWSALLKWYDEVMAVTADDVKKVANEYLVDERQTIIRLETGARS